MRSVDFPLCCTARIICDFGGTDLSYGDRSIISEATLTAELKKRITAQGHFLLTAITNSDQVLACRALEACGFKGTSWMNKDQHSETKIKMWWRPPTKQGD